MKKIKLSRLYWTIVISLCAYGARGVSLCKKFSMEFGVAEFETLCDLEFCTCHDPYGRVRCVCPGEDPDEELILKTTGDCAVPPGTSSLSIDNCKKVTVIQKAFEELKDLQNLKLINIKDVTIKGRIFASAGPPKVVTFINSTIPDVPSFTFTGNIQTVMFENCYVGVIRSFAFSSIEGGDSIVFRGTNVANVEAQVFKKFTLNKFLLIDSQFSVVPSRFVVDVVVETLFKIDSTFIDVVRTLGFKIYNPKKVIIINSMINQIHGEAFKIVSKGEVVFDSNVFNTVDNEAFRGLAVDRNTIQLSGKQKLKFQNQTITNFQSKSLFFNRTNFDVLIFRLTIEQACTCDGLVMWRDMITLGKKSEESIESDLEPIWCLLDDRKEGNYDYVMGSEFYKEHCNKLTSSIYFFVIIISATTVCIAITISIVACIMRRRKKWQPVPLNVRETNQSPRKKKIKEDKKNGKVIKTQEVIKPETTKAMIVPDGRTYKETEFHIIVEKAEPLDDECIPYTVVRDRSRSQMN